MKKKEESQRAKIARLTQELDATRSDVRSANARYDVLADILRPVGKTDMYGSAREVPKDTLERLIRERGEANVAKELLYAQISDLIRLFEIEITGARRNPEQDGRLLNGPMGIMR